MNTKEIEDALMKQRNTQKTAEEKKKEKDQEEKRTVYLQSFMTKEAIERCKKENYNLNIFKYYSK